MEKMIKCNYPHCNEGAIHGNYLNLINKKNSSVSLLFCPYHYYIIIGGHFQAKVHITPARLPTKKEPKGTPKKTEFEIIGPLKEVEICEQVVGAIQMVRLKSNDIGLKKD